MKLPDGMAVTATTNAIAAAASCVLLFQCNFRPKAQRGCWQSVEIALFSLETHTHILVLLCTTFVISTKFMYKKQFYIIIVSVWKNIILALSNHLILPLCLSFVREYSLFVNKINCLLFTNKKVTNNCSHIQQFWIQIARFFLKNQLIF